MLGSEPVFFVVVYHLSVPPQVSSTALRAIKWYSFAHSAGETRESVKTSPKDRNSAMIPPKSLVSRRLPRRVVVEVREEEEEEGEEGAEARAALVVAVGMAAFGWGGGGLGDVGQVGVCEGGEEERGR